jgi:hypothetical protein
MDACSKLATPLQLPATNTVYKALTGSVTAAVSKGPSNRDLCDHYQASVQLDSVYFREIATGKRHVPSPKDTLISNLIIRDQDVGTCQQP